MFMRSLLLTAAAVVVSATVAVAADMPAGPPVASAPQDSGALCWHSAGRQVDRVWMPGQVAYIVAATCGGGDYSPKQFLRVFHLQPRENVLVYYNGGSWWKTDIRSINVPYQPQLH